MPSSSRIGPSREPRALLHKQRILAFLAAITAGFVGVTGSGVAYAQGVTAATGFAVERLYTSAPGAAWVVMDDLELRGELGAALSFTTGYAYRPLWIEETDSSRRHELLAHSAFAGVAMAILYDRYRFYLNLDSPVYVTGTSGTWNGYRYDPLPTDIGKYPDRISDPRFGVDVRLWGGKGSPLRLGAGAQLFVPSGTRASYTTDNTYRSMLRLLAAGDAGILSYAGHIGWHLRPRDDSPIPGTPRGSELLFGIAVGPSYRFGGKSETVLGIGPELFGATAVRSVFGGTTTAFEALVTARMERTTHPGTQLRLKVGFGEGLHRQFGAPDWRGFLAVELSGRAQTSSAP